MSALGHYVIAIVEDMAISAVVHKNKSNSTSILAGAEQIGVITCALEFIVERTFLLDIDEIP